MNINPVKFGLACAIAFSVIWIVCSVLVMLVPAGMMQMTEGMVHGDLSQMQWNMSLSGIITGLVAWAMVSGVTGFLIALIYNRMTKSN